ncbi:MAG: hypothetical protein IJN78_09675 [Clostridia bacterium]|nr:hypothetical protein [Clostridia bacterium]MBQ7044850.1 hypothetical protein [Clostridia bacterium]
MDKKARKKLAPIIITIAVVIFSLAYVSLFVFLAVSAPETLIVSVIAIVIYLGVCIGVVAALRERIKEINGGEEDEALKY